MAIPLCNLVILLFVCVILHLCLCVGVLVAICLHGRPSRPQCTMLLTFDLYSCIADDWEAAHNAFVRGSPRGPSTGLNQSDMMNAQEEVHLTVEYIQQNHS